MPSDQNSATITDTSTLGGPTFLGIGVPKGASTWLYDLLLQHPDARLAPITEVHFFDRDEYFNRGLEWYLGQFPGEPEWQSFKALGEVTPTYLYCDEPRVQYIADNLPNLNKFICTFRNPIDRCYSLYKYYRRLGYYDIDLSFEGFLDHQIYGIDSAIGQSLYGKHLANWLKVYNKDQFLFLFFEEIFQDIDTSKQQIADFLDLDAARFPANAGMKTVNANFSPRFPKGYAFAIRAGRKLRDMNLYGLERGLRKLGIKELFSQKKSGVQKAEHMSADTRLRLKETFAADVHLLEKSIGRKIQAWKDFA
jgi:hypothetical protein